jgi:hypothetical protein
MNRFRRRTAAPLARPAKSEDMGGEWHPSGTPPEEITCATCHKEGHGHTVGLFYRMPEGWMMLVISKEGQGCLVLVCSDACASQWMGEHVFERDLSADPS